MGWIGVDGVNLKNGWLERVLEKGVEGKGVRYGIEEGVVYVCKKERGRGVGEVGEEGSEKVRGRVRDSRGEGLIGVI